MLNPMPIVALRMRHYAGLLEDHGGKPCCGILDTAADITRVPPLWLKGLGILDTPDDARGYIVREYLANGESKAVDLPTWNFTVALNGLELSESVRVTCFDDLGTSSPYPYAIVGQDILQYLFVGIYGPDHRGGMARNRWGLLLSFLRS